MYKRVLVALDGSPSSELALRHAVALAKVQRARLRLVYVADEIAYNAGRPTSAAEFWRAVRKAGREVLDAGAKRAARDGVAAETRLVELRSFGALVRHIPEAIVREAVRWRAELVVIGTHGRRGLSRIFLGSVADGVLRRSGVPVLLVRGR